MNRVIKFRAWEYPLTNIGFGRMYRTAWPTWNGEIEVWEHDSPQTKTIKLQPWAGKEPVLMQYTGLKDKNGKEIYEGDIIKILNDGFDGVTEIVEWTDGKEFAIGFGLLSCFEYEVIGNIYENPDLLREANND